MRSSHAWLSRSLAVALCAALALPVGSAALAACGGDLPAAEPARAVADPPVAAPSVLGRYSLGGSSLPELGLLASPAGRDLLGRVVACALPAGMALTAIAADGTPYAFRGVAGLAPGWSERPATATEQRQITACLRAGRIT